MAVVPLPPAPGALAPHAPAAGGPASIVGLGTLVLPGLLTHPHLGCLVLEYMGDDTHKATALRGTCVGVRDAVAEHG